jgi:hypothetical protein
MPADPVDGVAGLAAVDANGAMLVDIEGNVRATQPFPPIP